MKKFRFLQNSGDIIDNCLWVLFIFAKAPEKTSAELASLQEETVIFKLGKKSSRWMLGIYMEDLIFPFWCEDKRGKQRSSISE